MIFIFPRAILVEVRSRLMGAYSMMAPHWPTLPFALRGPFSYAYPSLPTPSPSLTYVDVQAPHPSTQAHHLFYRNGCTLRRRTLSGMFETTPLRAQTALGPHTSCLCIASTFFPTKWILEKIFLSHFQHSSQIVLQTLSCACPGKTTTS